jgi:hypothetical protein
VHLTNSSAGASLRADTAILAAVGFVSGLINRLARDPEDIRAENLRHWIHSLPDVTPLSQITARHRYKVAGVIHNIRIDPRTGRDSIEATITDGSGGIVAKWLGRSALSGITLGAGLIMEGVVGEQDGDLVMLNPDYDLLTSPEHG